MAGDSCVDTFAAALALLEQGEKQEFLVATRMLITVLHNLYKNPKSEKYRKLKTTSEIIQQILAIPYTHDCLIACNFVKHDKYYRMEGDVSVQQLADCTDLLVKARKRKDVMEAWEVFPSDLELGDKIGSGKFGAVFEGLWNGQKVAIKTMKRNTDHGMRDFEREADVMRKLKHPNVLNLLGVVLTQQPALIVLELMGASFLSLLAKCELTDKDILDCAMQVAAGLEYVHHRGYMHCDIACRNVLVSPSGVLKIADFGLARRIGSEECNLKGTKAKFPIRWTAPEVFVQQQLSPGSDVWSFGILFWEVVTLGDIPFSSLTNKEAKKAVKRGHFPEKPPNCRKEFYQVMKQCWTQDVEDRPLFTDIVQELLSLKIKFAHQQVNTNAVKEITFKRKAPKPKLARPRRRKSTLSDAPPVELPAVNDCITGPDASVPGLIRIKTMLISHDKMHVVLKASYSTKANKLIAAALKKTGIDESAADKFCLVEAGHNGVYQRVLDGEEYPLSLTASPFYSSMQDIYICRYDQAINIHASIRQHQAREEESYLDAVERTQQQQQQQEEEEVKARVDMAGIGDDDEEHQEEEGATRKRNGSQEEEGEDDFDMEKQPWFKRKKSDFGRCTIKVALKSAVYEGTGAGGRGNKDAPGLSEALYEDHTRGDDDNNNNDNSHDDDNEGRHEYEAHEADSSETTAAGDIDDACGTNADADADAKAHGVVSVNNVRKHLTKMLQSDPVPAQRPKPKPRPRLNRSAPAQDGSGAVRGHTYSHRTEMNMEGSQHNEHDDHHHHQQQQQQQHRSLSNGQPQNTAVRQAAPPVPAMRSKKDHSRHHPHHNRHSNGEHVSASKRVSAASSLSDSPVASAAASGRSSRDFSDHSGTGGRRKAANVKTMTEAWRLRTPQGSRRSMGDEMHIDARRVPLPTHGSKLRLLPDSTEGTETDANDLPPQPPVSAAQQQQQQQQHRSKGKKKRRPAPPPPSQAARHTNTTTTTTNNNNTTTATTTNINNSTSSTSSTSRRQAGKHVPAPLNTLQPLPSQGPITTSPKALVSPALTTVSTSSASSTSSLSSSGRSAEPRSRSSSRSSRRRSTLITIREDQQLALSEPNVEQSLAALHRRCSQESYSHSSPHSSPHRHHQHGEPLSTPPSSPRGGTYGHGRQRGSVSENGSIHDLHKDSASSRESSVSRSANSSATSTEKPKRGLDDLDRLTLFMMTLADDDEDDDDDSGRNEVTVGGETSTDGPLEGEAASGSETPTHATERDVYDDDVEGYTPRLTTKDSQRIARDMQSRSRLSEDTDLGNDAYIEISTSSNANANSNSNSNGVEGQAKTQRGRRTRPLVIGRGNPELAL